MESDLIILCDTCTTGNRGRPRSGAKCIQKSGSTKKKEKERKKNKAKKDEKKRPQLKISTFLSTNTDPISGHTQEFVQQTCISRLLFLMLNSIY